MDIHLIVKVYQDWTPYRALTICSVNPSHESSAESMAHVRKHELAGGMP